MAPENTIGTYLTGLFWLDSNNACAVNTMHITPSAQKMLTITTMMIVTMIITMTWLLLSRSSQSSGESAQVNMIITQHSVNNAWSQNRTTGRTQASPGVRGVAGDHGIQSTHRHTVHMVLGDFKWLTMTARPSVWVNRKRVRSDNCYFHRFLFIVLQRTRISGSF